MTSSRAISVLHARRRGEGRFGAIIGLLILVTVVYACFKLIPVYVKAWDFEDKVENTGRNLAASRGVTKDILEKTLLEEAQRLHLPVGPENIRVELRRESIEITVDYTVAVEFPGYTWNKAFHHEYSGRIFRT